MDNIEIKDVLLSIPGCVYWKSIDGIILGANTRFMDRFWSGSLDDLIGKTDFDMPWKERSV